MSTLFDKINTHIMIIHHFNQGWRDVAAAKLQDSIIHKYLTRFINDDSRTVLINNTWYSTEFDKDGNYLGEGDSFKNSVIRYVEKEHSTIDNIVVYCCVDPAWERPIFANYDINFYEIGYYDTPQWLDLHSLIVSNYFVVDKNLDQHGSQIEVPFMCLNGKPHPHRVDLINALLELDLINKGFVSFGGNNEIAPICIDEPELTKVGDVNEDPYDAMTLGDINNWNRHFLNVVTETVADVEGMHFWSEKIFKPILGLRPFLVYAGNGAVGMLTKFGFEHFCDDFKDISDLDLRNFENIPNFLQVLCNQPVGYLKHKYIELQGKINHNKENFMTYVAHIEDKINKGI